MGNLNSQLIQKLLNLVKNKGIIFLSVPNYESKPNYKKEGFKRIYGKDSFRALIKKAAKDCTIQYYGQIYPAQRFDDEHSEKNAIWKNNELVGKTDWLICKIIK